jgi:hypothetical protein
MALEIGVDSFVTLAESNQYHAERPNAEDWAGYEEAEKEAYLRAAYDRITAACTLSWNPAEENTPQIVKKAQCELAYGISIVEPVDEISSRQLSSLGAGQGAVELKFVQSNKPADGLSSVVKQWLKRAGCACEWQDEDEAVKAKGKSHTILHP